MATVTVKDKELYCLLGKRLGKLNAIYSGIIEHDKSKCDVAKDVIDLINESDKQNAEALAATCGS